MIAPGSLSSADGAAALAAWAAVGVTVFLAWRSTTYMRGKLDAHGAQAMADIGDLKKAIEKLETARVDDEREAGAQEVRNMQLESAARMAQDARDHAIRLGERLDMHLRRCDENSAQGNRRLERIEAGIISLHGEIKNVAAGRAGKLFQVRPQSSSESDKT